MEVRRTISATFKNHHNKEVSLLIDMIDSNEIKNFFRGTIAVHETMTEHTWNKLGGPADYFLEPTTGDELLHLVRYLRAEKCPYVVMGRGSNLLVSDEGFRGAVICLNRGMRNISDSDGTVIAEAGVWLQEFVDYCISNGYEGVQMLAGIPGTLGGAIIMNAGAYGGEIATHIVDVEIIRNGELMTVTKKDAGFSYRSSGFDNDVVLGAQFRFPQGDKEAMAQTRRDLIMKRNDSQPVDRPNCGSVFKNSKEYHAGRLIESCGLKGKKIGNMQISEKHANFIVNLGNGKAEEMVSLIDLVRRTVYQRTGIVLHLEVKLIGFSDELTTLMTKDTL
jgi:UDP-N-acetylmuramate dehydrogenase